MTKFRIALAPPSAVEELFGWYQKTLIELRGNCRRTLGEFVEASGKSCLFVAFDEQSEIAGTVFSKRGGGSVEFSGLLVGLKHQNIGLGAVLAKVAFATALSLSRQTTSGLRYTLQVDRGSGMAPVQLFQRYGFELVREGMPSGSLNDEELIESYELTDRRKTLKIADWFRDFGGELLDGSACKLDMIYANEFSELADEIEGHFGVLA